MSQRKNDMFIHYTSIIPADVTGRANGEAAVCF